MVFLSFDNFSKTDSKFGRRPSAGKAPEDPACSWTRPSRSISDLFKDASVKVVDLTFSYAGAPLLAQASGFAESAATSIVTATNAYYGRLSTSQGIDSLYAFA